MGNLCILRAFLPASRSRGSFCHESRLAVSD